MIWEKWFCKKSNCCFLQDNLRHQGLLTLNIAAVFRPESGSCCIKNTRKVSSLNYTFALHLPFLSQKSAAQVKCQPSLAFFGLPLQEVLVDRFFVRTGVIGDQGGGGFGRKSRITQIIGK